MSRPMWSGMISFGLVTIPVKLHSAITERSVRFHQVDKRDRSRLRQKLVNETTGDEVARAEIVKCYELGRDECVILDPKEIEAAAPAASRVIEISAFVMLSEIDPLYFDRPYYLVPDENAAKPYRLLVEAMEKTGRVGIARFVMREHEYLAAIRTRQGVLCLETMRFADEVKPVEDLGEPPEVTVAPQELKIAEQLVAAMTRPFDASDYEPEHRQRLLKLIHGKAEGGEYARPRTAPETDHPRVLKLVDALRASLAETKKPAARAGRVGPVQKKRKSA